MSGLLLKIVLQLLTSDAIKTLIGLGVNKLIDHSKDGITKNLAKTLIEGVVKSKQNPVTSDLVTDALKLLDKPDEHI